MAVKPRVRELRSVLLLLLLGAVARCATPPPVASPAASLRASQGASQGASVGAPIPIPAPRAMPPPPAQMARASLLPLDANGKPVQFNDPPASPDSPLCGRQAREAAAIATSVEGFAPGQVGICARFSCYDPLTATYLGLDGYRHVCR